jgi:hypothetical protein
MPENPMKGGKVKEKTTAETRHGCMALSDISSDELV